MRGSQEPLPQYDFLLATTQVLLLLIDDED